MQLLNLLRSDSFSEVDVSIVLPCRNEAAALLKCIDQIKNTMNSLNFKYEIVVSDSSDDASPTIARQNGCVVVSHGMVGYGIACKQGIHAAQGKFIIMADADWTYDFSQIPEFVTLLNSGYDLVVGNRLNDKMETDAMPWLHRHFGTPFLTLLLRILFKSKINDSQCGIRGFKKDSYSQLNLKSDGMEFASEMIAAAEQLKQKIGQVPVIYRRRIGESKLRPLRDGLRHLRFITFFYFKHLIEFKAGSSGSILRKL